jgi:hypothetical protein
MRRYLTSAIQVQRFCGALRQHQVQESVPVPADIQAIILRCPAKDPKKRYPDVKSLEEALAASPSAEAWLPTDAAAWWEKHDVETVIQPEVQQSAS